MRRALTALTLVCALFLSGCGEQVAQPSQEPEVTPTPTVTAQPQASLTLPYYPDASLHPITGTNRSNLVLASLVYEGLFELDNTFTPHEVLCTASSVSEDGLIWTLTLSDAVFSDGTPLTAADVVNSLELARGSGLYGQRLTDVQRVSANGDGTVAITLSRPNRFLPSLLDIPIIRDSGDGSMPLGTGPYAFVEDGGPLRLERLAHAPDTAPEEISLTAIKAADDLIYAFDAGNITMVTSDLTGANTLGYSSGYEFFSYPTTTMLYVGFQTAFGPCEDPLVRQAVSRALDRDTVTSSLLAGHAAATCLPVSPYSQLYFSGHETDGAYDPDATVQLLTQAGYSTSESLTMIVNTDNSFKVTIAEYLAQSLADLGVSVELKKLSWEDYLAALKQGNFDLYLGEVTLTADFDLEPLLGRNGALNYGRYDSDEFNALLEQLRADRDDGYLQTVDALLTRFLEDAPLAPLCFKHNCVLTQWQSISGLEPTRQNPFYHLESLRFGA